MAVYLVGYLINLEELTKPALESDVFCLENGCTIWLKIATPRWM